MVFETLLSVGTIESITLVESLAVDISGPLVTSVGGGLALGSMIAAVLVVIGGVAYVVVVNNE